MIPPELVGPVLAITLIAILVGGRMAYRLWQWKHPKPLPLFCTRCGCPMVKRWLEGKARFDEQEGWGRRTDRRILECVNAKDDGRWTHDLIELNETRTVRVESRCSEEVNDA